MLIFDPENFPPTAPEHVKIDRDFLDILLSDMDMSGDRFYKPGMIAGAIVRRHCPAELVEPVIDGLSRDIEDITQSQPNATEFARGAHNHMIEEFTIEGGLAV